MERLWPLGKGPSTGGKAADDGAGGVGGRKVGWDEEEERGRWRGGWKFEGFEGSIGICAGLYVQIVIVWLVG